MSQDPRPAPGEPVPTPSSVTPAPGAGGDLKLRPVFHPRTLAGAWSPTVQVGKGLSRVDLDRDIREVCKTLVRQSVGAALAVLMVYLFAPMVRDLGRKVDNLATQVEASGNASAAAAAALQAQLARYEGVLAGRSKCAACPACPTPPPTPAPEGPGPRWVRER